jgi:hypothetical protein
MLVEVERNALLKSEIERKKKTSQNEICMKIIQMLKLWKPLKLITLGQRENNNINCMTTRSEWTKNIH